MSLYLWYFFVGLPFTNVGSMHTIPQSNVLSIGDSISNHFMSLSDSEREQWEEIDKVINHISSINDSAFHYLVANAGKLRVVYGNEIDNYIFNSYKNACLSALYGNDIRQLEAIFSHKHFQKQSYFDELMNYIWLEKSILENNRGLYISQASLFIQLFPEAKNEIKYEVFNQHYEWNILNDLVFDWYRDAAIEEGTIAYLMLLSMGYHRLGDEEKATRIAEIAVE